MWGSLFLWLLCVWRWVESARLTLSFFFFLSLIWYFLLFFRKCSFLLLLLFCFLSFSCFIMELILLIFVRLRFFSNRLTIELPKASWNVRIFHFGEIILVNLLFLFCLKRLFLLFPSLLSLFWLFIRFWFVTFEFNLFWVFYEILKALQIISIMKRHLSLFFWAWLLKRIFCFIKVLLACLFFSHFLFLYFFLLFLAFSCKSPKTFDFFLLLFSFCLKRCLFWLFTLLLFVCLCGFIVFLLIRTFVSFKFIKSTYFIRFLLGFFWLKSMEMLEDEPCKDLNK